MDVFFLGCLGSLEIGLGMNFWVVVEGVMVCGCGLLGWYVRFVMMVNWNELWEVWVLIEIRMVCFIVDRFLLLKDFEVKRGGVNERGVDYLSNVIGLGWNVLIIWYLVLVMLLVWVLVWFVMCRVYSIFVVVIIYI